MGVKRQEGSRSVASSKPPVVPESAGQQWQQRVSELQEVTRVSLSEG